MANISNIIEKFILENMGNNESIDLARNELATYFSCAPSQINYVLSTRFTIDKGFHIESRRGGGGYVTVIRLSQSRDELINNIIDEGLSQGISVQRAGKIIDNFINHEIINNREADIIKSALSDKALSVPIAQKDYLRARILKSIIVTLSKEE